MKYWQSFLLLAAFSVYGQEKPLYENNFETAEPGKVPAEFLVLEGGFAVREAGGNKVLELPGSPLDSFAVLFGPTETANVGVSARINGTAKGRRFPAFGIGLNGVAGFKLQVSPAKESVELFKDQAVKATVPFTWKSGQWLNLRLQVRRTGAGECQIEGKVWPEGATEPTAWTVSCAEKEEPTPGRALVFASPYAGTPVQFDDFVVSRVAEKK